MTRADAGDLDGAWSLVNPDLPRTSDGRAVTAAEIVRAELTRAMILAKRGNGPVARAMLRAAEGELDRQPETGENLRVLADEVRRACDDLESVR